MNNYAQSNQYINAGKTKYNSGVKTNAVVTNDTGVSLAELVGEAVAARRRSAARERAMRPVYSRKHVKSSKPLPIGFIVCALIVSVVCAFVVYNYSVINEISYDSAELEAQIETLTVENQRLSIELEKRNDLAYIEDVAVNKLGMVKSTDIYKQYVSISGSDKTVVSQSSEGEFGLGTTLNGFKRSVGKIFE